MVNNTMEIKEGFEYSKVLEGLDTMLERIEKMYEEITKMRVECAIVNMEIASSIDDIDFESKIKDTEQLIEKYTKNLEDKENDNEQMEE